MDSDHETPPPISMTRTQDHPGHHSLPPANAPGPHHVYPSYPSSTLQYYYPSPFHAANYAHTSTSQQNLQVHSHSPVLQNTQNLLPSALQLHVPSLRHTPSASSVDNIHISNVPPSPLSDQQHDLNSCNFQRIHTTSPLAFHQPQPLHAFALLQDTFMQPNPILLSHAPLPHVPLPYACLPHAPLPRSFP